MTARSVLSMLLIGLVCASGLVGCGVSTRRQKISDASFVNACAAGLEDNATLATERFDVCRCIQDKLEAQGFGDRETADTSFEDDARTAGRNCARELLRKEKISDSAFLDDCTRRLAKEANL